MRKFVLLIKYGTGQAAMIVDTPDLLEAIDKFKKAHMQGMPDMKEYGLPEIISAQIIPIMYESNFKEK